MVFDPSWLAHIPEPNVNLIENPDVREIVEFGRNHLERIELSNLFPGFAWSILAGQESAQLARITATYPFAARIAFGFVEPDTDYFVDGPGLAVIVHICPPVDPFGSQDLQQVLGFLSRQQIFIGRDPSATAFPVIPRVSVQEPQVALYSPAPAMLTAWMHIRRTTALKEGWLLPLHAVGGTGLSVSYTDGSYGTVVDSLGNCMDAVVASSSNPPQQGQPCNADHVLPPGLTVNVTDQNGKAFTQTLMDIDVNLGLLSYQKAPIRLTYDWSSSTPGDSGALIAHGSTGAPVAMHQGASWLRDPTGAQQRDSNNNPLRRAFGICLYQVAHQLDGEFYL
jgi:hypothetical protein